MILLPLLLTQVPAKPSYRHFTNVRFAYSIDVPTFLAPGREPDNGDGRAFRSRDGAVELRVYGRYSLSGTEGAAAQSLGQGFRGAVADAKRRGIVRLAVLKPGFFALSSESKGRITYQRTIPLIEGAFATAILIYPSTRRQAMDPILKRTTFSLKALSR